MIWLIGKNGMLGSEVEKQLQAKNLKYSATDMEVDITSRSVLESHASGIFKDDDAPWIINCSAYTAVDKAEDDAERAARINTAGVRNIAECAKVHGARVIHVSTDYVFDGTVNKPLTEDMQVNPLSVYGKTKLEGEIELQGVTDAFFIIRTAWLYGLGGSNFVFTMLNLMEERETVSVVNDQYGSPTNAEDLASLLVQIVSVNSKDYGIYHYSDEGNISWFDFAEEIYRLGREAGLITTECKVTPCGSDEFPVKAKRPKYSLLSKEKVKKTFGVKVPHWKESLARFVSDYSKIHNRVTNWFEHADYDFETSLVMHKSGRYLYVFITLQQSIEKYLKAIYEYKGKEVPRIHDLLRLSHGLGLHINSKQKSLLTDLSYYYIAARYNERIKTISSEINKKSSEYVLKKGEEVIKWLRLQIPFV